MIFSHGGGTLPFLTERFVRLPLINKNLAARVPNGVEAELKRFYYDTAQAAHPYALASLTKLIPVSQIVFGTDFPYRTAIDHVKGCRTTASARAICRRSIATTRCDSYPGWRDGSPRRS